VPERFVNAVTFARLNLVEDAYPGGQHLILCRNVLIYFDPRSVEIVANKLAGALAPDGWLAVGPSDPRLDQLAPFELILDDRGVFYRPRRSAPRSHALPWPPPPPAPLPPVAPYDPVPPAPPPRPVPVAAPQPARAEAGDIRRLADLGDVARAEALLHAALAARPLDAELHFLHAVLVTERDVDLALGALGRCIYLDPTKAAPQLLAASLWRSRGKRTEAKQAYRAALAILQRAPATEWVPWVDDTAGALSITCQRALEMFDGTR
jgi:chemotaxis protein methyltransferase CheR